MLRLKGGFKTSYVMSKKESDRIWSSLINDSSPADESQFVVFNTQTAIVALNRSQIASVNFIHDFDPLGSINDDSNEDEGPEFRVLFVGASEPDVYGMESDPDSPKDADTDDMGQYEQMFFDLESEEDAVLGRYVNLLDEDGEQLVIRRDATALIECPHWLHTADAMSQIEEDDEDDNDEQRS